MNTIRLAHSGVGERASILITLLSLVFIFSPSLSAAEFAHSGMAVYAQAPAASGKTAEPEAVPAPDCTMCHSKPEYTRNFAKTKHGAFACATCHKGITDLTKHTQGKGRRDDIRPVCHKGIRARESCHGQESCNQCHPAILRVS